MSGERALPGLGLYGFWTSGSNGYRNQQGGNYRMISALLNRKVKSRVTALPGSPTYGDVYIVPSGAGSHPNEVALREYDTDGVTPIWYYYVPAKGWMFWVEDESKFYHWNGTAWTESFPEYVPPATTISTKTGNYVAVSGDFNGRTVIIMDVGTANTLTINTGLTGTEPLTVIQKGAGQTTILAGVGVTFLYAETPKLRVVNSHVSIIPLGSNTFSITGDVELAP